MKPRLLDLFCGAGGCSVGYHRAGFDVIGVDINPQPHYPYVVWEGDALKTLAYLANNKKGLALKQEFDAIHASPPCQAYTSMRHMGKGAGDGAAELIEPVRELLIASGLPYVIENVEGAPLHDPVVICGTQFDPPLGVRRHRLFETNWDLQTPPWPCRHKLLPRAIAVYGDHPQKTDRSPWRAETLTQGQDAMDIDWMPWRPLTQAIPPAYTEFIGRQLMERLNARRVAA